MRTLLIGLAIVIAVLAFVLDQVWLYWAAGALLVAAVVVVVSRMWRRYQEAVRFREKGQSGPHHTELSDLGILEVRPRTDAPDDEAPADEEPAEPARSASGASEADAPAPEASSAPPEVAVSEPVPADEPDAANADDTPASSEATPSEEQAAGNKHASGEPALQAVLDPYLQALRAAVDSHTACLLVQEDVMLTYRIAALSSHSTAVHTDGTFETDRPLLSASMSQQAITVRSVGDEGVDPALLGYYEQTPAVAQIALAPVPTPSAASTYFLVIDAADTHLQQPRSKKIITHFAELLGVLIEADGADEPPAPTPSPDSEAAAKPRPRREIIAEEIDEAQRASEPLALALVHLNRAEGLAQQGKEVVDEAEASLRARLERSAPRSRVERFGELTFGVFYNGDVVDVEPWAERLQEEMAGIDGLLAGGVSIGVAMLRDETQSPEALRENATEALWMAYETGTCTIVE